MNFTKFICDTNNVFLVHFVYIFVLINFKICVIVQFKMYRFYVCLIPYYVFYIEIGVMCNFVFVPLWVYQLNVFEIKYNNMF